MTRWCSPRVTEARRDDAPMTRASDDDAGIAGIGGGTARVRGRVAP